MAEEKKAAGKPKDAGKEKPKDKPKDAGGGSGEKDWFFEAVWIIFLILALIYIVSRVLHFFGFTIFSSNDLNGTPDVGGTPITGIFTANFGAFMHAVFNFLFSTVEVLSVFISFLLILGIIYAKFKLSQAKQLRQATQAAEEKKAEVAAVAPQVNKKWLRVVEHLESSNPGDWRLCILEADIILNELLEKMQYKGEGIGEKLKSVERSDFQTLDNAWEAHKIRNAIAHEGADFALSQREARRVINLYKSVFEEFYYI